MIKEKKILNKKKGGKKLKKEEIVVTQEEEDLKYKEAEVILNRELASAKLAAGKVFNKKLDLEDQLQETTNDFEDVHQSVQLEINDEEFEIANFEEEIKLLTEKLNEQEKHFAATVGEIEKELGGKKKALETQKYDNQVTLIILKTFKLERDQYLQEEDDLRRREEKQEKRHQTQLYQQEKSTRIDLEIATQAGIAKLQAIQTQIEEKFDPVKLTKTAEEDYWRIERELIQLEGVWQKMMGKCEMAVKTEEEEKGMVDLFKEAKKVAEDSVEKLSKKLERVRKMSKEKRHGLVAWKGSKKVLEAHTTPAEERMSVRNEPWRIINEILKMLETTINLTEVSEEQEQDITDSDLDKRREKLQEKQLQMIAAIAGLIDKQLTSQLTDCTNLVPPLPAIRNHSKPLYIGRRPIDRHDLLRSWKEPRFAAMDSLRRQTKIPIADLQRNKFVTKFTGTC